MDVTGRKIVVLGVPYAVNTEELNKYFATFGAIEEGLIMTDRMTGRSRGFGYVTFVNKADAETVLAAKHTLGGRELDVKLAIPKGERAEGGVPRGGSTRLFVAKIPLSVTDERFRITFEQFGTVTDAFLPKSLGSTSHRGIGFVTFESAEAAEAALATPLEFDGTEVAVDRATPKDQRGGGPYAPPHKAFGGDYRGVRGPLGPMRPFGAPDKGFVRYTGYPGSNESRGRDGRDASGDQRSGREAGADRGLGLSLQYSSLLNPYGALQALQAPLGLAGGGVGEAKAVHPTKLFIAKLPPETTAAELRQYFEVFGPVEDVYLPKDPAKQGRGIAFVTFEEEEVASFVSRRQHTIAGKQVVVDRATPVAGSERLSYTSSGHQGAYATSSQAALSLSQIQGAPGQYQSTDPQVNPYAAAAQSAQSIAIAAWEAAQQANAGANANGSESGTAVWGTGAQLRPY